MSATSALSTASSFGISRPPDRDSAIVHDRRVIVDGLDTQYLEAGSGPTLLLLHGHEQSATSWRWVVPALARTHRVLALSLPGHGDSAPAAEGSLPGGKMEPFVAAFLDALHVEPQIDLVGHSAGGAIALRVALAYSQRIRSLTLVDSAGLGQTVHPLLALDTLPLVGELAIMISRLPGGDLGRTIMCTAILFAQPWRMPAEFLAEQHALVRRPGQLETSTAIARALFAPHGQRQILLDRLPSLTTPTLVVWVAATTCCQCTRPAPRSTCCPTGGVAVFGDCGHLPHIEHPDRFAAVLGDWLAEHRDLAGNRPPASSPPGDRGDRPSTVTPERRTA